MDQKFSDKPIVLVDISRQKISLGPHNYPIKIAENGIGQEEGSFQTPLGLHRIVEKIGGGADPYTIFVSREPIEERGSEGDPEPRVMTRILRLEGLEEGYNRGYNKDGKCVDSYQRYIYIHGALREGGSLGCICLKPFDMIDLFDRVSKGMIVYIF